jgi:ribosomal protein S18 acetylase RimI-like enzyme
MLIRPATPDDLPTVLELRLALLREHHRNRVYRRLRPDAEDRARRLFASQLAGTDQVIFLADCSGTTLGILRCVHSTGSPLLYPAHYGYVSSVYVRPEARRQGVLRALLEEAERWCRARGLTEMRLHNAAENAEANESWEALGFEVVEILRMKSLA